MLRIIHSSHLNKALAFINKRKVSSSFILLDDVSQEQDAHIAGLRLPVISLQELTDEERLTCEKEYINSIAGLSMVYNSVEWWANPLSEKNEHVSKHYQNLVLFYRLDRTMSRLCTGNITLTIICGEDLAKQLASYCIKSNMEFETLDNRVTGCMRTGYGKMYAFMARIYFISNTIMRKMLIPRSMKKRLKQELPANQYYVIRSWVDNRFNEQGDGSFLPFFGNLAEYVTKQGYTLLLLAGIIGNYRNLVAKCTYFKRYLVLPEEYFVHFSDILRLLPSLYLKRLHLNSKVLFNGLDVSILFEEELNKGFLNAEYLKNLLRFFMAKRFAASVTFNHYIQTFENYAWEKMMLLGIRNTGTHGVLLGFQHAFTSRNSFKYFPGALERDILPLPDRIVSRGKITKDIMEKYGTYAPGKITIGCALRQEYLHDVPPFSRRRYNTILVPLTMVHSESALILKFLFDSGLSGSDIKVIIRCHPSAPFKSFRKHIHFGLPDNFIIRNDKSVHAELSTTDMVLYTWTTVATEAVKMGIPVIYLDILSPLHVDPLFECASFKRSTGNADELMRRIQDFYTMNDENYYREQASAQEYLLKDFYPVTQEHLAPFF